MAVVPQQQNRASWRDTAIEKSQGITDAWEVGKVYAGRLADWILFCCMVASIIDILPGVDFPPLAANIIMGVQAITLDVAGFGLLSMAAHAERQGAEKAAGRAKGTAFLLIALMIVTVTLISVGVLFPEYKPFCDQVEKGLILVRVIMTVVYGHIVHELRSHSHMPTPAPAHQQPVPKIDYAELARQVAPQLKSAVLDELKAALPPANVTGQDITPGQAANLPRPATGQPDTASNTPGHEIQTGQPGQAANTGHRPQAKDPAKRPTPATITGHRPASQKHDQAAIRAYMTEHPAMSRAAISKELGVPERSLRRILSTEHPATPTGPATGQPDAANVTGQTNRPESHTANTGHDQGASTGQTNRPPVDIRTARAARSAGH